MHWTLVEAGHGLSVVLWKRLRKAVKMTNVAIAGAAVRKLYLSALFSIVFAFGSTPSWAADTSEYASVHTIGIVSLIGKTLEITRKGITRFGNDKNALSISDWGIDDWVTQKIASLLSSRYEVKPIEFDRSPDYQCIDNGNQLEKCVAALPPRNDIDAYVFLVHTYTPVDIPISGLGIRYDEGLFSPHIFVHALTKVYVVDAKTGREIDYGTAKLPETVAFGDHPYPVQEVDSALWAKSAAELSQTQLDAIRPIIFDLLEKSIPRALINANLIPEVPPPANDNSLPPASLPTP